MDGVRTRLATGPSEIETEAVSDPIVDGDEGVATCVVGVAPLVGGGEVGGSGSRGSCGRRFGGDGVPDGTGAKGGDVRRVEIPLRGVGEEGGDAVSDRTGAK